MRRFYAIMFYVTIITALLSTQGCKNPVNKYSSPQGYDFNEGDKFNMPSSLLEISGITFNKGVSDTLYSIQDEDGKLYRQKWDVKKQSNMKFAPKGDFEDLAILGEKVFVLKSNGVIYSFPLSEAVKKESDRVKEHQLVIPEGEYEGMFADPSSDKIYVLCKKCAADSKMKQVTGYIFDYDITTDSLTSAGDFKIDLTVLKQLNSKLKANLSPSALARNPDTGEWYVLASANKLLVVTDENWKIKAAHRLNSSTFNQPEGIAFDQDLNLFISNEGDEVIDGNVLKFKYLNPNNK